MVWQQVATSNAEHWTNFTIGNNTYLGLTSSGAQGSSVTNSSIFRYNASTDQVRRTGQPGALSAVRLAPSVRCMRVLDVSA